MEVYIWVFCQCLPVVQLLKKAQALLGKKVEVRDVNIIFSKNPLKL